MTTDILEDLEERGLVTYNENDEAVKAHPSKHLKEAEVVAVLLPLVVADLKVSNRELARTTGLDPRSVSKYRGCDAFLKALAEHSNKRMVGLRNLALDELEKGLCDNKLNANTKAKYIAISLQHTERMTEIMLASKAEKTVSVDNLIKELADMG